MPQAIREMQIWQQPAFESEIPKGLQIRKAKDASGRDLLVVNNSSYKAFSLPVSLLENSGTTLPEFFKERIATL